VTDNLEAVVSEITCQLGDIVREQVEAIGSDPARLVAQIVSALVESHDMKSKLGERGHVVPPREPEFGKAVQQNEQGTIGRAGLRHVQFDPVGAQPAVGDRKLTHLEPLRFLPTSETGSARFCGRQRP
jgi:hypothetical protein